MSPFKLCVGTETEKKVAVEGGKRGRKKKKKRRWRGAGEENWERKRGGMGGGEKMEMQLLDREVERREGMRGEEVPLFLFCEFKLYVKPFQATE